MRNLKKFCTFLHLSLWPAPLHPRRRSPPQKHRPRRPLRRPRPRRSHSRLRLRRLARSCARFRITAVSLRRRRAKPRKTARTFRAYPALRAAASPENTESDILRIDGEYIYTLTDKNLTIFHLSGEAGGAYFHHAGRYRLSAASEICPGRSFAGSERTPLALFLSRLTARRSPDDVYGYESLGAMCYSSGCRRRRFGITTFPIRTRLCSSRAPVRAAYTPMRG